MKRIYDFSRTPSARSYTASDLQALKGSEEEDMDKKLALEWSALKRLVADETMDYEQ